MTVREVTAFQCPCCGRLFVKRGAAEHCLLEHQTREEADQFARELQGKLDLLVGLTGVMPSHGATIAVGSWPEGTDPPCVPGSRVAIRWVTRADTGATVHSWGNTRDGEEDLRPEVAGAYTLYLFRMMEARARADGRAYEGVRAARKT